jgi:predicted nucleic acid-binding protein
LKIEKIYLDTSVISFYYANDAPEKMEITRSFFAELQKGAYEVYISVLVLQELARCSPERQAELTEVIKEANVKILDITEEVERLAGQLVDEGVIPVKYDEDALHLAVGIFYEVDYLASWNFKHIVKVKTKRMVTSIAIREGYKGLQIISPTEVLENG